MLLTYSKTPLHTPFPFEIRYIHINTTQAPHTLHPSRKEKHRPAKKVKKKKKTLQINSMANSSSFFLALLLALLITTPLTSSTKIPKFIKSQKPLNQTHHHQMRQKLSHLSFYWHDILSGSNPTAMNIVKPPSTANSTTAFGLVNVIDDPLTVGPATDSQLVGRAQGLYAAASQETVGLMMAMNLVFVEGKYNGSTITILGRNEVMKGVREMPVIGGSGLFRFASGYVQARTHTVDFKTGDACVHYDCYVMHY